MIWIIAGTSSAFAQSNVLDVTCNDTYTPIQTICKDGGRCGDNSVLQLTNPPQSSASPQDNINFINLANPGQPVDVTWMVEQIEVTASNTPSDDAVLISITGPATNPITPEVIDDDLPNPITDNTFHHTYTQTGVGSSAGKDVQIGVGPANTITNPIFQVAQYKVKCTPAADGGGTIKIEKDGPNNVQSPIFDVKLDGTTVSPAGSSQDGLKIGEMTDPIIVSAGSHTVSEDLTNLPFWQQDSINCRLLGGNSQNPGPVGPDLGATFTVATGSNYLCVVTNSLRDTGQIKIEKETLGDQGAFQFTHDLPVDAQTLASPFTLDTTGQQNNLDDTGFITVPAGTYSISETVLATGFTLKSATCTNKQGQSAGTPDNVTVGKNDEITCRFVNEKGAQTGSLEIQKVNVGGDAADIFGVTATKQPNPPGPVLPGQVSQNTPLTLNGLTTGTYVINEVAFPNNTSAADYDIQIACSGPQGSNGSTVVVDPTSQTPSVCTITNTRKAGLTIQKVSTGGVGDFAFTRDFGAPFNITTAAPNVPVSNAGSTFTGLTPGDTYTVTETVPAGWTLQSIDGQGCTQVGNSVQVTPQAGDNITCTFVNFKKTDDPMDEVTQLFVHRRVDNLLTHGPDRARLLRRMQDSSEPPPSLKDAGPIKLNGNQATVNSQGFMGLGATDQYAGHTAIRNGEVYQSYDYAVGEGDRGADYYGVSGTAPASNSIFSQIASQLTTIAGGTSSFKFSTSLSELRQAATEAEQRKQEQKMQEAGLSFAGEGFSNRTQSMRQGWDVWAEGHISKYNDGLGGYDRDGDFRILYVGADYALAPGVLIGALVQIDDTKEDVKNAGLTGEVEGTGWMAGPYIGIKLADNLFFDARAAYGTSENDIWLDDAATGYRKGSFDTDRWLASATLTGNQYFGNFRLSPQFGFAYGNEWYDDYFNNIGQLVPGRDIAIGRLNATLEAGYRFDLPDGTMIEPHISIAGLINFSDDDLVIGGQAIDNNDARAKLEGGVIIRTPEGYAIRAAASYDGIGQDDFEAYSGSLWINIPLN